MNSISCFIIDDEPSVAIISKYVRMIPRLKSRGHASNPSVAMNTILSSSMPDVLIVNMDFIKDIELELFRQRTLIIVTSSLKENAFQAYELSSFDYLLKPFSYERFLKTMTRVVSIFSNLRQRNGLYLKCENRGKIIRILYEEISYIEASANYVDIVMGKNKHIAYKTLKSIEEDLPDSIFIRVHKSFIVNETKIQSLANEGIVLKDSSKVIKVGPSYREKFLKRFLPSVFLSVLLWKDLLTEGGFSLLGC